ncbi:MAG: PilZ domain-containing protein [Sandaracinus sp.]|nr:PilZ domain-containing protein [Sandaracinus sp.]MCB9622376.1 PilZ domain-containing protein [Sandaracinus sp.]
MLRYLSRRRVLRRALRGRCEAVALDGFRRIGERVLDVSPHGMLLAADGEAQVGDTVIVTFQLGTDQDTWYDAEAEVARIIEGWREGDPGYALGLRFTHIDLSTRLVLAERLVGTPPPVPQRAVRYLPPARA